MSEIATARRTRQLSGRLTDLQLRNLTTRDRPYKVADGNSLYVLVAPTGLRAWRWKYHFAGREKLLPLGSYPEVGLAQARAARDEARKRVLAGIDPAEERRDAKLALLTAQENSFEAVAQAGAKPIFVLCYNEPLAVKLESILLAKGLAGKVHARNFHKWCRQQLVTFGQALPKQGPRMFDEMVDNVIRGVERSQIPSGQYQAILIDEGHDFQPAWLKLVTQMVDPSTNSLLL